MCQKFQKNLFAMNFWNYFFWYCFDFELEVGINQGSSASPWEGWWIESHNK